MIHSRRTRTAALAPILLLALAGTTPAAAAGATAVPMDSPRWSFQAVESQVEEHLGRQSLRLKGGAARLEDLDFSDGIIEFDVAFGPERGFCGVGWRVQGPGSFEHFYLRPHQSGKPDSLQYTPNFNGVAGWQLYHGAGYGAAVELLAGEWLHVKLVVSGGQAEAFVDSDEPVLFMHELKRGTASGGLALVVADFAPAYFSNFSYQAVEAPPLRSDPRKLPEAPAGTVEEWSVSAAFDGASLDGRFALEDADTRDLEWEVLASEASGIANLARIQGVREGADTAFVRLILTSERAQTRLLRFGYSDRVRVYLGRELLYSGDNGFQSRDFRYLGTIGLFDGLPLRLAAGENELLFAVSESFGGWGIQAAFEDGEGIRVRP